MLCSPRRIRSHTASISPLEKNGIWPSPSDELKAKIEAAAQEVLDVRANYPGQTLAALYDPLFMPLDLVKAHAHLDALVDKAYGLSPSCTDAVRVSLLFKLYAEKASQRQ